MVADHEALQTLLRDRPDGFRRTRQFQTIGAEIGLKPGVFVAEGDAWRTQRRMVMAGFDPAHIKAYFPSLLNVTRRLRDRWQAAAASGATIDLQADLMRYTVDAIAGLAFGSEVDTLGSNEDVIQRHLDKLFPAFHARLFALVPTWRLFRSRADRDLERSVAAVNDAIAGFIAEARERLRADPARRSQPPNLLEAMIVASGHEGSGVGDAEIAGNTMTMLLAGEDTTANTLAWMIYLLHRHPHVLRRARAEVDERCARLDDFSPQRLDGLDYIGACAHETMRLRPVAPFQVLETLRETVIGDLRVPADTAVWCVMRHDSVDERFFPRAGAFEPERWLPLSAGSAPASAAAPVSVSVSTQKRVSAPFGAGPRICPGRYVALLEIKLAIAMLLACFEIDAITVDGGSAEPAERMAFTMAPVGLRMRLRVRSAA